MSSRRPGASERDGVDLPRQRPRLGTRRRSEPVRRARLRERGLDVRPDHRPLLSGHRARPRAGRARARAARRVEAVADDHLALAVPRPGRLRNHLPARRRLGAARTEAPRDGQRRSHRPSGPGRLPAGDDAARARRVVPGPDRGRGHGPEVERDQHRRRRAVPRRRRAEGDAERLARRGAQGAGCRGAFVCTRQPGHRQGVRPLRRRAQPGLRRRRRRDGPRRRRRSRRRRARSRSTRAR